MIQSKVLKGHNKNCSAIKQVEKGYWDHPWSSYPTEAFFATKTGNREAQKRHHVWTKYRCNSTECKAEIIIRNDTVLDNINH